MANMNFGVNILPKANNTYTLGNSDYKWNIFANSLNGVSLSNIITDVQVNGTSILSNNIANIPLASTSAPGVVMINGYGLWMNPANGHVSTTKASTNQIKEGTQEYYPIVPYNLKDAVFYGLAKAAGDSTQSASSNAVGTYTANAKSAIQTMLEIPKDIQINNTSIINNGIANIPIASWNILGVVKASADYGLGILTAERAGIAAVQKAETNLIKAGTNIYKPIVPYNQHEAVFYGLAKAAGDSTQSASSNAIGLYTDSAKTAIKNMLAVPKIDDNEDYDLNTTWSAKRLSSTTSIYSWIGSNFSGGIELPTPTIIADQKIDEQGNLVSDSNYNTYVYALTLNTMLIVYTQNNEEFTYGQYSSSSISSSDLYGYIITTNSYDYIQITAPYFAFSCEKTTVSNHNVIILYMGFTGVTNTDYATAEKAGVVKIDGNGLWINSSNGKVSITKASTANIKSGTVETYPIVPYNQHEAVFYGLAKAAGDTTQSASSNAVGVYTDSAKASIKSMLGITSMTGATSSAAGTSGLVPAPATTDVDKFLAGDGTYKSGGLPMVILSYGNSTWQDFINAYNNNVIVYCRASSNSNPASGSQTRMAFMAYVNDASSPTNVEFQYYRSMNAHSATAMGDEVYIYKLTNASGGTWSVTTRKASIKEIAVASGSKLGVSWSSDKVTLSNTMTADDMPMSSSDATTAKSAIDTINTTLGSTTMGTTATTVTGAIAEHENDISTLNSNIQIIDYAVGDLDDDIAMKVTQPSGGAAGQVLEMGNNGEVQWGDKIPSEDVVQAVEGWLDANMPPQETIIVDNTLSTPHAAAEAKATGDALSALDAKKPGVRSTNADDVDLDIVDQNGNVLVRMKDGHIQTKCFNSTKYGAKVITIKKDGSGDFSVLSTALASITDADYETNPYEIHIYPGTYNTLEGYTDEEIRSADIGGGYTDDSFVGAKLKDGVSLIGIGDRSQIILTAELSTSDYTLSVRGNISTLNLQGSCRIENLTIKAKNIRYCIHDDFGTTKHCTRIVKNCVFVPLGNLAYHPATTYGAGIRNPGMTGLFEDCDFGFSWGMHTRQLMTGGSNLVLRNCSGLAARIGDNAYESDTVNHLYVFDDCNFQMIQITRQSATTPHVEVAGTNNFNTMMISPDEDCPQIYNLIKTEASNLPVGTVVNVGIGEITATSNGIHAVKAANIESALGVIVFKDSVYDYIQSNGYIQGKRLGISSLSVGDYITVNSDMKLVSGGTVSNAFGVVRYTDSSDNSQIWIIRR